MKIIKRSIKPFKSGKYIETVVSTDVSPITNKETYILSDGSYIECRMVRAATPDEIRRHSTIIFHEKFYPEILRRYVSILGAEKYYQNPAEPCSPEHLTWMLVELDKSNALESTKHRWLGYIQGVLISQGLTTLEDERNLTRPFFKG